MDARRGARGDAAHREAVGAAAERDVEDLEAAVADTAHAEAGEQVVAQAAGVRNVVARVDRIQGVAPAAAVDLHQAGDIVQAVRGVAGAHHVVAAAGVDDDFHVGAAAEHAEVVASRAEEGGQDLDALVVDAAGHAEAGDLRAAQRARVVAVIAGIVELDTVAAQAAAHQQLAAEVLQHAAVRPAAARSGVAADQDGVVAVAGVDGHRTLGVDAHQADHVVVALAGDERRGAGERGVDVDDGAGGRIGVAVIAGDGERAGGADRAARGHDHVVARAQGDRARDGAHPGAGVEPQVLAEVRRVGDGQRDVASQ
jgi:hypothetical protein